MPSKRGMNSLIFIPVEKTGSTGPVQRSVSLLYEERCSLYETTADYIIETKNKRATQIVLEIEEKLNSYENN